MLGSEEAKNFHRMKESIAIEKIERTRQRKR